MAKGGPHSPLCGEAVLQAGRTSRPPWRHESPLFKLLLEQGGPSHPRGHKIDMRHKNWFSRTEDCADYLSLALPAQLREVHQQQATAHNQHAEP